MKNIEVPRNCQDRDLVKTFQQIHDAVTQIASTTDEFDVHCALTDKNAFPPYAYNPATDGTLDIWLDAADTSTLFDPGGAAITNGATVGRWESKAVARSFRQYAATTRPTWLSAGWMGLPAVRSNNQLLTATSSAGYASLSGITAVAAEYLVAEIAGNGQLFGITEPHETVNADSLLVSLRCNSFAGGGGRRHQGDAFGTLGNGALPVGNNTALINAIQINYTASTGCAFQNGVTDALNVPFQAATSGNTAAAPNPFGISVGGFAQETAAAIGNPMNGWIGEVLVWKSVKAPSELVPVFDYLRRRWGGGLL